MTRISEISTAPSDDAALLHRFVATHDELAFNALVQRHGPMVLGICRRILRSSSDADDAFQATFLLLAVKAKQIGRPHLLGNWLFGVATRTSIGIRRANHRRVVQEKRLMRFLRPRHRDETKDADLRMMLDEQISKLPEKLRHVIVCCHLEGLTKREAAERLSVNDSTIMQRLKQARELMKRRLGTRGAGLTEASLGTILIAVAVPTVLSAGTVKAATLVTSGKITVAGAATGKAAGVSKGASSTLLATKIKLAATVVIASTLAIGGAVAVTQQRPAVPIAIPATQPAIKLVQHAGEKNTRQIMKLNLPLIVYLQQNGFPADPKIPNALKDGYQYLGVAGVRISKLAGSSSIVTIAEKPAPGYDGPIAVAFVDGSAGWFPQAVARQMIDESRRAIDAVRAGATLMPAPQAPAPLASVVPQVVLPQQIREALEHNAAALGPITLAWTNQRVSNVSTQQAIDTYYVGEDYFLPESKRIIWQDGNLYGRSKFNGNIHETAWDASIFSFTHTGNPPQMSKQFVADLPKEGARFGDDYFDHAGIHLPSTGAEIKAHATTSIILAQMKAGAALTAVDSVQLEGHLATRLTLIAANPDQPWLHALPSQRTYIYLLDPAMNYALRHSEQRYASQLLETADNEQFENVAGRGVWLPRKTTTRLFTTRMLPDKFFSNAIFTNTIEVTTLSATAVGSEQFVLTPPPGARITDRTIPRGMAQPGQVATPAIANAPSTAPRVLAQVPSVAAPAERWWGGIMAGCLAIAALIAIGMWRFVIRRNMIEKDHARHPCSR